MMLSPSSDRQVRAGRSAIDLLDDENHQVATIYATRAGLHIQCGPRYELDGNGQALWALWQYGKINVVGNTHGLLNAPYTAFVIGDFTGQTVPPHSFYPYFHFEKDRIWCN